MVEIKHEQNNNAADCDEDSSLGKFADTIVVNAAEDCENTKVGENEQFYNNSEAKGKKKCNNKEDQKQEKLKEETERCKDEIQKVKPLDEVASNKLQKYPCDPAPPLEIKLFVGRIPHSFTEEDVRPIFIHFGKVVAVSIIRDKNGVHKGAAFVRMACLAQADSAVRALNNQKVLDEKLGAIQVKYAAGEMEKLGMADSAVEEGLDHAKLFVGSIPKTISDEKLKSLFEPYGQIEEIYIMKDAASGVGKGCAFIKYKYKEQAMYAAENLDRKQTLESCSRPLEVRLASRSQRQQQSSSSTQNAFPSAATGGPGSFFSVGVAAPPPPPVSPPSAVFVMPRTSHAVPTSFSNVAPVTGVQPANSSAPYSHVAAAAVSYTLPSATSSSLPVGLSTPKMNSAWKEYFNQHGRPYYHNELTNVTQWERPLELDQQVGMSAALPTSAAVPASYAPAAGGFAYTPNGAYLAPTAYNSVVATSYAPNANVTYTPIPAYSSPAVSASSAAMRSANGSIPSLFANPQSGTAGPPGANIFVFHLPSEWTTTDLIAAFSPFGNVKNAKIARDNTADNKTKGYAFVSYDNQNSAIQAVKHMNGFAWGGKKLKVTIKKGEEHLVQHLLTGSDAVNSVSLVDTYDATTLTAALSAATGVNPFVGQGAANALAVYNGRTDVGSYQLVNSGAALNQYIMQQQQPQLAAQYTLQTATPAAQYGTYAINRYAPY